MSRLRIFLIAASMLVLGFVLNGLPASAVETSGTVYVCANQYTGQLRLTHNPTFCSGSEVPYEIEGERWFPPPPPPSS